MEHTGRHVSSDNLSINFRTNENEYQTLEILKKFQCKTRNYGSLQHKIFHENGAPYMTVKTSLYEWPQYQKI